MTKFTLNRIYGKIKNIKLGTFVVTAYKIKSVSEYSDAKIGNVFIHKYNMNGEKEWDQSFENTPCTETIYQVFMEILLWVIKDIFLGKIVE